jgi:outer membrane protein TolC
MNRPILSMVCLLSLLLAFCNSVIADDKAEPSDKIKELKEKRLAVLVKISDILEERQRNGIVLHFDAVHKAKVDVLAARLDLAETKEDRIKVCEEAVKEATEWEAILKQSVEGGFASPIDLLKAQAATLESRIALEKAKAQGKKKPSE